MTAHTKTLIPALALALTTMACEEKAPAPAEAPAQQAAPAPAAAPAPTAKEQAAAVPAAAEAAIPAPYDVCQTLVGAAKSKDDSKVLALSTPATSTALAAPGAKEHVLSTLAGATCGAGKAEGDSATVVLGGTEPQQEATFTKTAEGWKFDGAAFLAKYPVKVVQEKAKKAAAKATHGKAGHKKHGK